MPVNALQAHRKALPELAMRRTYNRSLSGLIVEGISDRKLFEKFVAAGSCAVFAVGGKAEVLSTVDAALTSKMLGVVGIVDADVELYLRTAKPRGNVFRTEVSDADTLVFASSAFLHLFREGLREGDERTTDGIAMSAERSRATISQASLPIGLIRCAAAKADMRIAFSELSYNTFVNTITGALDEEGCIRAVLALPRTKLSDGDAKEVIVAALAERASHDIWEVVRGHDLTRITALCSERFLGRKLDFHQVEASLRLAYDYDDFKKSSLYLEIAEWSSHNAPFIVWK